MFRAVSQPMLAAALGLSLAGCDIIRPEASQEAQAALAAQDYLTARDLAQGALAQDSKDAAALEVLVRAQLAMGAGEEALATLEQLAKAEALPQDHLLLKAEAHLQTGDPASAKRLLQGQGSAESWRLRALAASLAKDDAGALEAFAKGRDASGNKARLFVAEATHHLQRNNRDAARDAVARAQEVAPRRVETQYVTGWLAQIEGNAEIAARAFLAILEKTPQDRPAMLGAIDAAQQLGRDDLADPLLARGRAAYPGDLSFTYFAARAHARKGDWAAARDLLQQSEAELAGNDPAQLLYAEALLELGQREMARAIVTPIHSRRSSDAEIAGLHERIMRATGN